MTQSTSQQFFSHVGTEPTASWVLPVLFGGSGVAIFNKMATDAFFPQPKCRLVNLRKT